MNRRFYLVLVALCLAALVVVAVGGCSGGSTSSGSTSTTPAASSSSGGASSSGGGVTITEQNFSFNPQTATVKVGDTVTWTNADSVAHNVKIDGQELGPQNQGESKTWKATKAGTYPFSCIIHPSMTGQITVQ
jgi:plastocyanin